MSEEMIPRYLHGQDLLMVEERLATLTAELDDARIRWDADKRTLTAENEELKVRFEKALARERWLTDEGTRIEAENSRMAEALRKWDENCGEEQFVYRENSCDEYECVGCGSSRDDRKNTTILHLADCPLILGRAALQPPSEDSRG